HLVADQRVRTITRAGAAAGRSAAARRRTLRQLRKRWLSAGTGVLPRSVSAWLDTCGDRRRRGQCLERIRARLFFVLHLRPVEHWRVRAEVTARSAGQLDDRATPRTPRPGRVDC